ncbi:Sulfate permease 2 [Tilletia horrida]|uniref:Sulfate permease 2 n=1 Tax=Tilletia horrida TaxID=155126 RepID=A0AAN6JS53_9BASI|nr:Sulfate permease 2 [Tilletia horrida]KAK0534945.1 Sulfate permease 2 [Tilletia horrida]KAK0535983.1 Sulfate permease 2 [Tilletia horrida]KAK0545031.1 Sulfate permease 2 [Tilletia horrida]
MTADRLATGPAPAKPSSGVRSRATHIAQAVVGHNDNEALRSGVPIVSTKDWIREQLSHPPPKISDYFPLVKWLPSYNLQWGIGDLIAGITVALVLVPQSMSYAQLANLAPEFGLYSSFVGVMIYALFATSKDVTIGPVAVMSLQTGNTITRVLAKHPGVWKPEEIASAVAFLCGVITLGVGLLRLGWITRYIPAPAVSGFMTGSAITIAAGQVPKLMGLTVTTNGVPTYKVIINSLKALPQTNLNAAFGLSALAFLYLVRGFCNYGARRWPRLQRTFFFISVLRNAFVIIVLTIASKLWLNKYNVGKKPKFPISILKDVPRGFKHMGQPNLQPSLLSAIAPELPVSVIVLLLEHIAIAQSFGRVNNYKINPNQELMAIGVTNMVGPTFGAYAATGSFSRTAIKAKSGVRTPIAGWITGIVVVIAIYALTGTFFWIPSAALSAVIIHAVGDLIASPRALYQFWLVQPLELAIWFAAVFVTIFVDIEKGIYTSILASLALLLVRVAQPRGRWLGLLRVSHLASGSDGPVKEGSAAVSIASTTYGLSRTVFLPLNDESGLRDPSLHVRPPPPGVLIYRPEEGLLYANVSRFVDIIADKAQHETRPGLDNDKLSRGDRPWNDPGPPNAWVAKLFHLKSDAAQEIRAWHGIKTADQDTRPTLKAIIIDLGSVSNVDTTSIQALIDVRRQLERYAGHPVEFHFASILSPWIRRGLLAGGFGTGSAERRITEIAPVVPHHEELVPSPTGAAEKDDLESARPQGNAAAPRSTGLRFAGAGDEEKDDDVSASDEEARSATGAVPSLSKASPILGDTLDDATTVPVQWAGDLTPFFHLDVASALDAVIRED